MYKVSDMIDRMRVTLHDEQKIEYEDSTLLTYLNDGVRILRRTCMQINPDVLITKKTGTISADNPTVSFTTPLTQVIRVTVDNYQLEGTNASRIEATDVSGRPKAYYLEGFDTMRFFPVPDSEYSYTISYVDDMTLLESSGTSPFPNTLDDLLIEYAQLRASISNEYNVQEETSVVSMFTQQIEQVLNNLVPQPVQVEGYWDSYRGRRHRWRR